MLRSDMCSVVTRVLQACLTGLLGVTLALPSVAAELTLRKLHIESIPSKAEVLLIGGSAGLTPLTVDERAIYPNDYPNEKVHLYGTVTFHHADCETLVHRVTRGDLEHGLQVTLDCDIQPERSATPTPSVPVVAGTPSAPVTSESISQQRLRQLQVLQELLDEGLITPAEEQRIRRKLLETL